MTASRAAAGRVARNSAGRALGEGVGKVASLALTVVLAREAGVVALGAFVVALAWAELTMALLGPGLDRILVRRVARDRSQLDALLADVLVLKAIRSLPLVVASWAVLWLFGYASGTRVLVYLLTAAFLLDALNYSLLRAFDGVERADLVGLIYSVQRTVGAGLGIAALLLGYGVRTVAAGFVVAAAVAVGVAWGLLVRQVGRPALRTDATGRRAIGRAARPFALQEVLSGGLARLDAVLISLLATQSVVGVYGAAYRLFEATLLVSMALTSAFVAMFTYLEPGGDPPLGGVFARSLKVAVFALTPVAVAMIVLPESILALVFGTEFTSGSGALRALGPTAVLLGIVMLATALLASRRDPRLLLRAFAAGLAVNLVLNLALVPSLGATGAGLAMLGTELLLAGLTLRLARPEVGRVPGAATFGAAVVAGVAMAAVLVLLPLPLLPALLAGCLTYVLVFAGTERRVAPADLDFVIGTLRGRLVRANNN